MIIKKSGGKIFGAQLTAAEKKAMNIEIQKQLAELDRKNIDEMDAMILWYMHAKYDFEYQDLREFHEYFRPAVLALCNRYEMTDKDDDLWLCTHKLLDIGVDVAAWNRESD